MPDDVITFPNLDARIICFLFYDIFFTLPSSNLHSLSANERSKKRPLTRTKSCYLTTNFSVIVICMYNYCGPNLSIPGLGIKLGFDMGLLWGKKCNGRNLE